jgi:signal transduction histidine kinase/CheY-like chemotaxis protein
MLKRVLILAILFVAVHFAAAQQAGRSLHTAAQLVRVGHESWSLEEFLARVDTLSFSALHNENENIDFTDEHYWVKFELNNPIQDSARYFLRTARPITDEVDLYQISSDGTVTVLSSGDTKPFRSKSFHHRESVFSIILYPQTSNQFYLHFSSDGEMVTLPLRLYTPDEFFAESTQTEFIFGVFYGVLLIAALVYLFFYFSLKQRAFLYYGIYIISFAALQFALDGYMHQYIFSNPGWLYSKMVLLTASLSTIFLGLYAEKFLQVDQHFKHLHKVYRTIYGLVGILLIGLLVSSDFLVIVYPAINGLALVLIAVIIGTLIALRVKRIAVDAFFTLGIFFLTVGLVVFILNNFSVVPSNFITQNSSKIGGTLEIIFLSLSMSNLIRKLREEKELSRQESLQKAEEANALKLHLMSNVSHELRTPLNAIMGLSSKVQKEASLTPEQVKDMDIIQHSSEILLGSINNLLDFYKIEKRELTIESQPFNLLDALRTIDRDWKLSVETKDLSYAFDLHPSLPDYVYGDQARFLQVVENLFENAIKFTQHGTVHLSARATQQTETTAHIEIEIRDTGVGIPKEKLHALFSGFAQAQTDDKRAFGGLGLGLSIAKAVAELQGGKLRIESEEGKGTTCHFNLPFVLVAEEDKPQEIIKPNAPELPEVTILIVEDNKLNQLVIKQMLSTWKNTTYALAENGQEALDAMKEQHFDLILMDLQMPVMDGYEAASLIRAGEVGEHYRNIPIIAVTADTTEQTKAKVKRTGMNDYQSKPFTTDVLYTKVYRQIERAKV